MVTKLYTVYRDNWPVCSVYNVGVIVAKRWDGSRCHLVQSARSLIQLGLLFYAKVGDIVLDGDPVPPRKEAHQPSHTLFDPLLWHGRPCQQLLSSCFVFLAVRKTTANAEKCCYKRPEGVGTQLRRRGSRSNSSWGQALMNLGQGQGHC